MNHLFNLLTILALTFNQGCAIDLPDNIDEVVTDNGKDPEISNKENKVKSGNEEYDIVYSTKAPSSSNSSKLTGQIFYSIDSLVTGENLYFNLSDFTIFLISEYEVTFNYSNGEGKFEFEDIEPSNYKILIRSRRTYDNQRLVKMVDNVNVQDNTEYKLGVIQLELEKEDKYNNLIEDIIASDEELNDDALDLDLDL